MMTGQTVSALLCLMVVGPGLLAAEEARKEDQALVAKVAVRLLGVVEPMPEFVWPPIFVVEGDSINAFAWLQRRDDGKLQPRVAVTPAMLKEVIKGDADRLALILGHELGHILHKHVVPNDIREKTPFLKITFTRAQETEADKTGVELMMKAGFSLRKGIKGIQRMIELGMEYSSFEGLGKDHPSWNDRLVNIDRDQPHYWKSMSAFQNGVVFLTTEQYLAAQECFERVTKEFPGCYEAWVNLGFACLMQYCDGLTTEDLRDYGLGQILCGGFYQRPGSLVPPVRGKDSKLWWKAVGSLREALRLKPDLTLAKANLGLAYLIHPDGKDVGEAARFLQEAAEAAPEDKTLDAKGHAMLLVNLGVANLAAGKPKEALTRMEQGEKLGRALRGGDQPARGENQALASALLYNRAMQLAAAVRDKSSQQQASELLEKYLRSANPLSAWWPLAYEKYSKLRKDLGLPFKERADLQAARTEPLRLQTMVPLPAGASVSLGEDVAEVAKRLGEHREITVAAGTNLKRLRFEKHGVELLVTDVVLAICLGGPQAPALSLKGKGIGSGTAELRVGMSPQEVEKVLGDDYQPCELTVAEVFYRFYREQGVAVRLVNKKVTELVVVQIPKR